MLQISQNVSIADSEIELAAVRAQGAGGQNVNKVSTAIHLRFNINTSSLPAFYKHRLLNFKDRRINKDGIIVIKAQQYRTQEKNRQDAIERLKQIISQATIQQKIRRATKPSKNAKKKRLENKSRRSQLKTLRSKLQNFNNP